MISRTATLPTLTVGVILLRRLGLALRQYNLTLELLQLRLELVQLAVSLLHNRRNIGQRFAVGRDLPQLLCASLYLQLLQTREDRNEDSIKCRRYIEETIVRHSSRAKAQILFRRITPRTFIVAYILAPSASVARYRAAPSYGK